MVGAVLVAVFCGAVVGVAVGTTGGTYSTPKSTCLNVTTGVLVSALPFGVVVAVVLNVLLLTGLVTKGEAPAASLPRNSLPTAGRCAPSLALAVAPVLTAANTPRLALPPPNSKLCELSIMLSVTS